MSLEKHIDLIVTGETFCVVFAGFKNKSGEAEDSIPVTATNVVVDFTIPDGIEVDTFNTYGRGSYNPGTKRWSIGNILPGEELSAEVCFTIVDGCKAPWQINALMSSVDACADSLDDNNLCVTVTGLSCCDLNRCNTSGIATNDIVVVPNGAEDFAFDVSGNDDPCPDASLPTYQWSDLSLLHGTISGLPDNAEYTPTAGFCGVSQAEYEILCNGNVQGRGLVWFYVSCANAEDDHFYGSDGVTFNGNVATNDTPCSFGASTTYHLVSDDTADGTISEPTSMAAVTVTEWDQSNGDVRIVPSAGWSGIATFQYFIRCTMGGVSTDSNPVTVHYRIESDNPLHPIQTISDGNYTLSGGEKYILLDNSSNAVNIFAAASSFFNSNKTKSLIIKCLHDPGTFDATFTNTEDDVIDDTVPASAVTNFIFTQIGETIEVISDGTDFYIVSKKQ